MAFGNYSYNPYAWSNPYAMPQYQPQAPQMQSPNQAVVQQGNGIRWVQGEAGAKAYPVGPGESAFLMDSETPMAYLKTADQSGMPSMRYYSITEISQEAAAKKAEPNQKTEFATLEDLAKVRDDIGKLKKSLKSIQATMEGETNE